MAEPLMLGQKTTASVSTAGDGAAWANRTQHRLGRMKRRWHRAVPRRDPAAAAVELAQFGVARRWLERLWGETR